MIISVTADQFIFETAIAAAEQVGAPALPKGLNAPLDAATTGRLDEAWSTIKTMLQRAYESGSSVAATLLEKAQQTVDQLLESAGNKARQLQALLSARLREYQSTFVEGVLHLVRAEIKVGEVSMKLSQIKLAQKIVLSGSVKAALAEAFALTSCGEFQIEASYTIS